MHPYEFTFDGLSGKSSKAKTLMKEKVSITLIGYCYKKLYILYITQLMIHGKKRNKVIQLAENCN